MTEPNSKFGSKVRESSPDERAVSPVIGVILMVAIVVILAAVIGFFVLGLGSEQNTAPQASFSFEYTPPGGGVDGTPGSVTITHDGGDSLPEAAVSVVIGGTSSNPDWSGDSPISAGDSVSPNAAPDTTVRVVYTNDNGQTSTLATFTTPA